jgi:hypothetical protein
MGNIPNVHPVNRLDAFKTAGSAKWRLFKSRIEGAWNDCELAFEESTNSSAKRNQAKGDNP